MVHYYVIPGREQRSLFPSLLEGEGGEDRRSEPGEG
jgi:hypothetical protein